MKAIQFILVSLFFSASVNASTLAQNEINHLLNYIESTQCKYERNGSLYSGVDAVSHIKKKYNYYADDIKTAEDFIRLSATKSMMSGNFYKMHCKDQAAEKSQNWLLKELSHFRENSQKE